MSQTLPSEKRIKEVFDNLSAIENELMKISSEIQELEGHEAHPPIPNCAYCNLATKIFKLRNILSYGDPDGVMH